MKKVKFETGTDNVAFETTEGDEDKKKKKKRRKKKDKDGLEGVGEKDKLSDDDEKRKHRRKARRAKKDDPANEEERIERHKGQFFFD